MTTLLDLTWMGWGDNIMLLYIYIWENKRMERTTPSGLAWYLEIGDIVTRGIHFIKWKIMEINYVFMCIHDKNVNAAKYVP